MNPWVIVAEIGITIGLWAINKWLTDTPDTRAKYLQDAPTATEGSPLSILIGRRRIKNPTFMWYGGFASRGPIDWGGISQPDGAVNYGVNMLINLGIPMGTPSDWASHSKLWGFYLGEKFLYCPLTDGQGRQLANVDVVGSGNLYTGPLGVEQSQGVVGYIQFFGGGDTQQISNNAASAPSDFGTFTDLTEVAWFMRRSKVQTGQPDPTTIPGYAGQMLVALTGKHDYLTYAENAGTGDFYEAFYFGSDPHIPPLSFEVSSYRSRYNSTWGTLQDNDPASAMYDVLTLDWGKLGIDVSKIDDASFAAASTTLLSEKLGYSRIIDSIRDGKDVLQEIVNHVCGVLYMDPLTGRIHLKLIRNDYDIATIPSFTAADVISVDECTVGNWRGAINQVRVKYYDRKLAYNEAIAVAQNMASAVMQDTVLGDISAAGGDVRSVTVEYPGCCTFAAAQKLAQRDLRLLSQPLQKGRFTFTRKAAQLRPGDVFKVTFPDYPALTTAVVFRATSVDLGQPGDGKVVVDCIQDVFSIGQPASYSPPESELFIPQAAPITRYVVTEEPRWILNYLKGTGAVHDADLGRLLVPALPDDGAGRYQTQTLPAIAVIFGITYSVDMGLVSPAMHATVSVAYDRSAGPYDTTTGLVIEGLTATQKALVLAQTWSASQIRTYGYNIVLVGSEVISYESATDSGGGTVTLHNVWRGLLDTAAQDHVAGEHCYWIGPGFSTGEFCGHYSFAANAGVISVQLNANMGLLTGSGEDPVTDYTVRGRVVLPQRVANPRVCGQVAVGTNLRPTVAPPTGSSGMFGKTSRTEEGIGYDFTIRSRTSSTIARGDDAAETAADAQTYEIHALKVNATQEDPQPGITTLLTGLAAGDTSAELRTATIGYGDVDLMFRSRKTSDSSLEWDTPKVRLRLERWRNLLGNVRWAVHGAGTNLLPHWTGTGTPTIVAGTKSISGLAGDLYAETVGGTTGTYVQTVDVTDFRARGQDAWVEVYGRAEVSAATTKVNIKIDALDAGGGTLGTTNADSGALPTGNWKMLDLVYSSLPATTTQIKITLTLSTDLTQPQVYFTEPRLRIGTFTRDVLTNGSFETGSTSSWTNGTNSFVADTTSKSPSANYARGGAFATSEIYQEYTIPAGWEVGSDAILTCWRKQSIASDPGEVTLDARDSLGSVLSNDKTGNEDLGTTSGWVQRRLFLKLPEGSSKLRVTLTATRSGGAGNSGAMFDDVRLSLAKDGIDARYYRELSFDNNTEQSLAATWQEWHVDHAELYRSGIDHPIVFAAGAAPSMNGLTSRPIETAWSDGLTHSPGVGVGIWGGTAIQDIFPTPSVSTYAFTRSGADFETTNEDGNYRHLSPSSSESFAFIVIFRVDEEGFATACGLLGRRGGGLGWGLKITAGGFVQAVLDGSGGAVTATCTVTPVTDGAWHYAAIVYDANADTLTVRTEYESASASTASVGEIENTDESIPFRLGRSFSGDDCLPGAIAFGYWFDAALTGAQVAEHWSYGDDPTGLITSYVRPGPAWVPGARDASGNESCVLVAADQVAVAYVRGTYDDRGMALATGPSSTNRCHSFDLSDGSYWSGDGVLFVTQGVVDATGRAKGATVASATTTQGIVLSWVDVVSASFTVVFWAKASAAGTMRVQLTNSMNVFKSNTDFAVTTLWTRYSITVTGWDASTPTAKLRFCSGSGTLTFTLSSVMHVEDGTNVTGLIPRLAGTALGGDTYAIATDATIPDQFNAEGEVIVECSTHATAPTATSSVAYVDNSVDGGNAREFRLTLGTLPAFIHYDSAGGPVTSSTGACDPSQGIQMRGRWAYVCTLDAANAFAGLVTTASVSGSNYGRATNWTYNQTNDNRIQIGNGPRGAFPGFVHRILLRAREEKLV